MPTAMINPKIQIRVVRDGEIHITFAWSMDDLENLARAYLAMSDGKIKEGDVIAAFILRDKIGVDYLIDELQKARKELFG